MKNNLEDQIFKYLNEFTENTEEGLKKDIKDVVNEGIKKLQQKSRKKTGKYAKGWDEKTINDTDIVIYNKKKPGLTHLLEKGHAKRGGGRVSEFTHIAPIEEWIIDELEKRTIKRLT